MATVFIWNNNVVTSKAAKVVRYAPAMKEIIGHAAMSIDDSYSSVLDENIKYYELDEQYVSWMPGEDDRHERGKICGFMNQSFFKDLMHEGYAPDHIIRIPNPPKPVIDRMQAERNKYEGHKNGRDHHHDLTRKNCSRILSRVLRRGWGRGGGNIRYGQTVSGLWTPLMVKRLALDLKGGPGLNQPAFQMSWDAFLKELEEKRHISRKMRFNLTFFMRRANNRGSSGADARFQFSRFKLEDRKMMNRPAQLLIYAEAMERGKTRKDAVTLMYRKMRDAPFWEDHSDTDLWQRARQTSSDYDRLTVPPKFR
ncbi:MAG: hypothetical protein MI742_02620 [Desulfobacterales bacterium]|nr:hypothetical protein [Desulfobacterales bacterium]